MENKKEFYVENYDWNEKKIIAFNIFRSVKFSKEVEMLNNLSLTDEQYIEELRKSLQYCFWSKREYERSVGDAFETDLDKYKKIDVYEQCLPNINIIAKIARGGDIIMGTEIKEKDGIILDEYSNLVTINHKTLSSETMFKEDVYDGEPKYYFQLMSKLLISQDFHYYEIARDMLELVLDIYKDKIDLQECNYYKIEDMIKEIQSMIDDAKIKDKEKYGYSDDTDTDNINE